MDQNQLNQPLFDIFPPVATSQWEAKIMEDLKGADYDKKLIWKSDEGFEVKPYYRAEDLEKLSFLDQLPGEFPFIRHSNSNNNSWEIRQDILVENLAKANAYALELLNKGATSLGFVIENEIITSVKDFEELLKDIRIDCIELNFKAGTNACQIALLFEKYLIDQKISDLKGSLDLDPLGLITSTGNFNKSEADDINECAQLIYSSLPDNFRSLMISGSIFGNAGSTLVQELGFSLSMGAFYLNSLTEKGLAIDEIAKRMIFNFSVGSNYFMEIAKLRAARLLWAKIVEAHQPESKDAAAMYIHAITTDWNKTIFDPHVNMLRTTTEAMSAAIGGANSLTVKNFDSPFSKPSKFGDRIARNTQIILKEECYLEKIVDPGAGSYYIEQLTASIAENAWKLFLEIESEGGYLEAFKKGIIQNTISESADKKLMALANRKEVLLGTNQFPNPSEKMNEKIYHKFRNGESKINSTRIAEPIKIRRAAIEFEQIRLAHEQREEPVKVFLLTIGNLTMRKARASFASGFFGCAGYQIIDNPGFNSISEGITAAKKEHADILVLCSSDEEYETLAPEAFAAIPKDMIFVVAGAPGCTEDLKKLGIKNFIHLKSNILDTLNEFNSLLNR